MSAAKLTLRYLALYIVAFIIILWGFYLIPSSWIEALTAQTAAGVLSLLGHSASWAQTDSYTTLTLIGQRPVTVNIIRECTALNVLGVMAGLIIPLKTNSLRRVAGVAFSGILLFTLNIPRIALTVYLTAFDTWPLTLISDRSLDTYHYPISFVFGVVGVAITVLAVSKWTTPELADTLLGIVDEVVKLGKKNVT